MPTVDRDCADLLKDVPEYIIKQMKEAQDPKAELASLKAELARKKDLVVKTQAAQVRLMKLVENHPEGPTVGLRSIMTNDLTAKATNSNIEYRQKALQGVVESKILDLKKGLSTTKLGLARDKELGRSFIKAIFGESDDPHAIKLAKQWEDAAEFMRTRFNEYGGNIGKLDYGYINQSHNSEVILNAGKDEWLSFIRPLLRDDVIDDIDLNYVFETISTGGLNKVKEGAAQVGKGKSVANKNAEERVLHFKDGDSWIAYNERFGKSPDPMAIIDDHIRGMTQDMSLVEIMGPNPTHMYETLKVKRDQIRGPGKPSEYDSYTDAIWNVVNGNVDQDHAGIGKLAGGLQVMRAVNTSTMLGSATLSAMTDSVSLVVNTKYNNMSAFSVLKNFVKNFDVKNQDEAIRMGLGADVYSSEITARFSEIDSGFWAKASEAMMRATAMNIWTESARKAFQTEYMHKLLDGRNVKDLEVDELIKMLEEVNQEASYAVLMPGARTRAITTGGHAKGTYAGESARTMTQFKSFTITFMQQHGSRMLRQGTTGNKFAYGSSIFLGSTMMGAIAMMAKDAAKGYDVREGANVFDEDVELGDNVKFWSAAAVQGGGAGIFGDFIFSDQNRFGGGIAETIAGPTVGVASEAVKLTFGNLQQAAKGETTNFGSESIDFANRHANPVNTFYIKAAIENYVARNLKIVLDPDYEKSERRKAKKRRKDSGQEKFEWLEDSSEEFSESVGAYNAQEGLQDILDSI